MIYRVLGKSALSVSRIGFGCMSLGEKDTDNSRLLHAAIEKGINFFDTADLYGQGRNEITVGKALKEKRKGLVIATKVGNQWKQDGSGWLWNPGKEYILAAVNDSLQRLQTDYIDLYQLHGGTIEDNIDEALEAFNILQQQGKIRYYGISSIRPNVIRSYACRSAICSVMMQYSLLDRRPEESCFDLLADKNIGVLARGGLAGGLLVNKPAKAYLNYGEEAVKKAAAAIGSVSGNKCGSTQTALQYVLQQPAVTSAVVGIRTKEQLDEALKTMESPLLTGEELIQLQNAIPKNYYKEHR
ncbi:MAG TPA: aldo/keto reductase [Chitinophagaceae bacterium]|nr:aldo/keto reductase [Chitinophagaceae bacterium]